MRVPSEFTLHIRDVFRLFGPVQVRRMFGGYGLYREGLMFAVVVDETLYLKTDAETVHDFRRRGLPPFQYLRRGKPVAMSYYQAPEEVMEDAAEAARWARRAFEAALRARNARPLRRRAGS
ncbi:MAG: TfoX/Sxy family protein [Pseudomonadota bacterium]|nr:MAG: transcriptional regulator [Pseudomonadota bacterium]